MDTSLQNTGVDEQTLPVVVEGEEEPIGEVGHIHLPGPSIWPIILSVAIAIAMLGFLIIDTTPWVVIISLPLMLIGALGWALEDPMKGSHEQEVEPGKYARTFGEAAITGKPTPLAEELLQEAEDVVDKTVTISSTAWSAHPVKVFVEREGAVLSLYGKVELEAQKQEIERNLRNLPGVLDVMNFLVAEDELLNNVNRVIEDLKKSGKIPESANITALVENYIVSLYGDVPDIKMKYLLEREISGIPGARVVINHIGLNENIPGNLGKTTNRIARI
ncbi:MAG TPA: cytochrome c oxidase subunit 4 [Ktedonobacteraceae bacterium]|nr:cytochrome c oxidase subunit 4 [Ktedonobacteraceae bacterium]